MESPSLEIFKSHLNMVLGTNSRTMWSNPPAQLKQFGPDELQSFSGNQQQNKSVSDVKEDNGYAFISLYPSIATPKEGAEVLLKNNVKEWIDREEMFLKNSQEEVKSLWVGIRDQGNNGNLVVGVYYKPPDQGEPTDEAFLLQLQEASCSKALILLWDFSHPNICWKSNTASCRQSSRFLECLGDNFLRQEIDSPTQGEALPQALPIRDVKIGGSLGCSGHALVEFTVLRDICLTRNVVRTMNFRKTNLQIFKELVKRTPWEMVLRENEAELTDL
ncbi:egf-like repeat and discoidin i-like domain-containing protein 3 [Limosa lapponica baueri]|uniref:Egf-like repeat and discoidin i-like domain-containing protein 3 n=1 Tax=Limosa lapponica baueri TaxID=1758121 RepID=A0A2I0UCU8_LIMLA|nr:egf-like repeat and discoidin i-like domain-containing protein 3 [Limosa lapponica baueri]